MNDGVNDGVSDESNDDMDVAGVDPEGSAPFGLDEGLDEGLDDGLDGGPDLSAVAPQAPEHTGNPVVDSVLDSLRNLEDVPVSEHVAVFEAAHDRLRSALSDAGNAPADS